MKISYVALAVLMCSALATGAGAVPDWSDDFESYSPGVLEVVSAGLYSPESNTLVTAGSGYLGTQGVVKNPAGSEHHQLHAYRPTAANISTLSGRTYAGNTMGNDSHAIFGAISGTSYNAGDAWMGGNGVDCVDAQSYYGWGSDILSLASLNHFNDDDPGVGGDTNKYVIRVPKQANTWYDLKVVLDWNAGVARGYYRVSGSPDWLLLEGEGTFYDHTWTSSSLGVISEVPLPLLNEQAGVYNDLGTVGLMGRKHMGIDDIAVGVVPEPSSLMALALGLPAFALIRRRR